MKHNYPNGLKKCPFDDNLMEATIVDQKIDNLLSVLNWDLKGATQTANTFDDLFFRVIYVYKYVHNWSNQ